MLLILTICKFFMFASFIKRSVTPALFSTENKLLKNLFYNYSPHSYPVTNPNSQIVIKVGIELIQLLDILERDQMMVIKIWIRLQWKNEFLTWEPSKWGNISSIDINPDLVWIPELILHEEIDKKMSKGVRRYHNRIQINPNGDHFWAVPLVIKSSCAISVREFPFDHQTCSLKFGSWLDETKIYIISDNRSIATSKFYINSSEWDLINASQNIDSVYYPCCRIPIMDITYKFTFRRKSVYYVFNLIIPCVLLIIIVLCSFFLPSDCIERIGIIVTVLLAFIVFLQMMDGNLPKCSESTPVLTEFYLTAMVESVGSIIGTCIVILLYRRGKEKTRPVPEWIRRHILKVSKPMTHPGRNGSMKTTISQKEHSNGSETLNAKSSSDITIKSLHTPNLMSNPKASSKDFCQRKALVSTAQHNASIVNEECESESIEKEWKRLAELFDRVVFVILLLLFVASICLILLPAYLKSIQQ